MLSLVRNRFGIPGVLAVAALVFAMAGGAYAAKKYIITSTSQIKPSVLKKLQGKQGPIGPQGPAGSKGDAGAPGTNGAPGANGKSVAVTAASCGGLGGAEVKQEGASSGVEVCNGEDGQTGFTETLPSGKTETGTFSAVEHVIGIEEEEVEIEPGVFKTHYSLKHQLAYAPLSFNIPLDQPIESSNVVIVQKEEGQATGCPGAEPTPTAEPGYLCVYLLDQSSEPMASIAIKNTAGGAIMAFPLFQEGSYVRGTWAVSAP